MLEPIKWTPPEEIEVELRPLPASVPGVERWRAEAGERWESSIMGYGREPLDALIALLVRLCIFCGIDAGDATRSEPLDLNRVLEVPERKVKAKGDEDGEADRAGRFDNPEVYVPEVRRDHRLHAQGGSEEELPGREGAERGGVDPLPGVRGEDHSEVLVEIGYAQPAPRPICLFCNKPVGSFYVTVKIAVIGELRALHEKCHKKWKKQKKEEAKNEKEAQLGLGLTGGADKRGDET